MLRICVLNNKLNLCILLEFYGKNNLEAAYIDQILDTLQDLVTAAIPYLVESKQDKDKKVKKCLLFLFFNCPSARENLLWLYKIKNADQPTEHRCLISVFAFRDLERITANLDACNILNIIARLFSGFEK